ncbi:fimbrial protein [Escherichia whittamii]|uniref:fimbrial protein n=1 Tax=Escherichia whittamii TaxID=2762229 RepID=UPI002DB6F1AD|nr:fimbrial protein [Escherichia whittamii]EEZ4380873.1 fimbrial protein [Escherichia coli]MEB7938117.1 fimbrial protein [Escherichia whittamii]
MKSSIFLAGATLAVGLLTAAPASALTGGCEAQGLFTADASFDWSKEQNVVATTQILPSPLTGNAYQIECSCDGKKNVGLFYFVTSALAKAGKELNYYQLNDNLDILTEVNDIPGATAVTPRNTRLIQEVGGYKAGNAKGGVCSADPAAQRAAPKTVGSNTRLTLYVTKPFLGELIIPDTHIASIQAAWSDSASTPNRNVLKDIAELHVQGRITVPQDCKINQGDVIQVDLGFIGANRFTTKDQMPEGYRPVEFDITYDCGDTSTIKNDLEMVIDGAEVANQRVLIARRRSSDNVPDVGIRIIHDSNSIPFINGQIKIDQSGRGSAHLSAYPVNLVGGVLEPGKFRGTATITVIVK